MNTIALGSSSLISPTGTQNSSSESTTSTPTASFSDYLQNALNEVDGLQKQAEASADNLATGDVQDLHNTMIAYEKASLALELTVAVRDKMVDAYKEIMQMQM